jgi:hypothetical protein
MSWIPAKAKSTPSNRPFHASGSQTATSITLPAASACRGCAAQNDGSPVIGVVVPGGV